MSHNLRTSYFDDLKEKIIRRYPEGLVDQDSYRNYRANWQTRSMFYQNRRKAFFDAPRIVTRCFAKNISAKAQQILVNQDYIPEFMYYSTMGRADLVQFANWNAKYYLPRDPQPSISDLRVSQNDSANQAALA
jgi:hypothetical protein